jgi:MarR family transcriptional regulator, 2-MHQ and catechol-resistance regulon repressor
MLTMIGASSVSASGTYRLTRSRTAEMNTIGPKVWLTPGSISVAVDRLVKKGLVSRKDHPDDRRVRRVELTPKGRALIARGFGEHAAVMENVANVLSKNERLTLLRLLKKLGKHAAETRK